MLDRHKNKIMITDLKEDDALLTLNPFEHDIFGTKFIDYLRVREKQKTIFTRLTLDNKDKLEVSPNHLVYTLEDNYILAKDVRVGDSLVKINSADANSLFEEVYLQVTSIETVELFGAYAPLTKTGTLLVNGFYVTSFAGMTNLSMAWASF